MELVHLLALAGRRPFFFFFFLKHHDFSIKIEKSETGSK